MSEPASTVSAGREFHSGIVLKIVPFHRGEFLSDPIKRASLKQGFGVGAYFGGVGVEKKF